MKIFGTLLICFLLPNVSFSKFLENLLSFSTSCPDPEESPETVEIITKCIEYNAEKMEKIDKNLRIIDEIFDLHQEHLVLIIAYNTNDAIELAKFLTRDKKLLPRKHREDFPENEAMYDLILENVHFYKEPNESTIYFAYPMETNYDASFMSQLLVEVMLHVSSVKLLTTLATPVGDFDSESFRRQKELEVFRIFEVTARILRNITGYKASSTLMITSREFFVSHSEKVEERDDYLDIISRYTSKLNASTNGKILAQNMISREDNVLFIDRFPLNGPNEARAHLDKISYVEVNIHDYLNDYHIMTDCWYNLANVGLIHSMNSLPLVLDSHLSRMKPTAKSLFGMYRVQEQVNMIHKVLSVFLNCTKSSDIVAVSFCFQNLSNGLLPLRNPTLNNFTTKGNNYGAIACFIHSWIDVISSVEYINETQRWTRELDKYTRMLRMMDDWYLRLKVIYDQVDSTAEKEITKSLHDLRDELKNHWDPSWNRTNREMMRDAHDAVKSNAIKMRATGICSNFYGREKLQVTGNFVKLSSVLNRTHCTRRIGILEIFALDKVLIDTDIVAIGQELRVSIFAPIWEVFDSRTINLDGLSRNLTDRDFLAPKARNGNNLNANGAHGRAGLLGGAAGTFHGLAGMIINAQDLRISLNGGNGTNGQDGGDGAKGDDGLIPDEAYVISNLRKHPCRWYSYSPLNFRTGRSEEIVRYDSFLGQPLGLQYRKECYIFGLQGFPGGNGGNGGIAGKGGKSGEFKLLALNGSSIQFPVIVSVSNGTNGKDGSGGTAGQGGSTRKVTMRNFDENRFGIVGNETITRASDGNPGLRGKSFLGSEIARGLSLHNFGDTANLYKKFVFSRINNHKSKYVHLHKQLVANRQILKNYDTLTLVNELADLEQEYHLMFNKSHALFLYQSWKEGILDYFLHRPETEKTNEYQAVHRFLDNMVSEKIKRIRSIKEREIFVLSEYLLEFRKQLKSLKNARKVVQMKVTKTNLSEVGELKIEKTQRIIQETIQMEIDQNNQNLTGEMETILRRMASRLENIGKYDGRLKPNIQTLKEKFVEKILNDVSGMINTALGLINPWLAIIGLKFSEASSRVQSLIDDSADRNLIDVTIPEKAEQYRKYFENRVILQNGIQMLVLQVGLNQLEKKMGNSKQLENLAAFIKQLENGTSDKLPKLDVVEMLNDKLEKDVTSKKLDQKNFVSQLKTLISMKQMVDDLFPRLGLNGTSILEALGPEMGKVFRNASRIRNFHEEVYLKLAPLIQKMIEIPESFSALTYLDLKNFELDKSFLEILQTLETFVSELRLQSFGKIIPGLQEAIKEIFRTFDKLYQHVEELKKLPYVRDLLFPPFDITLVKDAELGLALTRVIQLSLANNILDDYDKWMGNFKQFVFPFPRGFNHVFRIRESDNHPNHFKGNISWSSEDFDHVFQIQEVNNDRNDLASVAEAAGEKLETYGSKLKENRIKLVKSGKITFSKFGYNSNPFHVWNISRYSREINGILSGERVTLFANISDHREWNAVKFSDLWLRITPAEEGIEKEEVIRDLQSFSVKLLHHGDSYYRCGRRVFMIPSKSYDLQKMYGDEAREMGMDDGIPMGKFILSPYATWTVELVSRDDGKSNEVLKKYESKMNIELVGLGQLSPGGIDECGNLDEYKNFEIRKFDS